MSMLLLIYIFVTFGVIALAITLGGRYERASAAIVLVATVVAQIAQSALHHSVAFPLVMAALNLAAVACLTWLYWRHRASWLALQLAVYVVSIPVDWLVEMARLEGAWDTRAWTLWWIQSVLVYLQNVILCWAVLRRQLGPPYPLPRASPS